MEQADGALHRHAVATVPVDQHHAAAPVGAAHELDDDLLDEVGADGERAGEPGVLAAGGDGERWGHQDVALVVLVGEALGQRGGDADCRCRAAGAVRAVRTIRRAPPAVPALAGRQWSVQVVRPR